MSMKMKEDGLTRTMGKSKMKRLEKSKPDAERDSGFSDASSEHLSTVDQADADDASRLVLPSVSGSRSQPSQMAVMSGSFQNLSPMIIMNNVLLKQQSDNPSSLKPWGFSPTVEVVQQPRVVFLQPVVSQRAATVPKGPPSKRRRHKKYLPILKSYPRIAPHPGDGAHGISSSSSSSSSSTTALVKSCNSSSSSQDRPHGDKQQDLQSSASSASSTSSHPTPTRHLPASPQPQMAVADSNTDPSGERSAPGKLEATVVSTDMHAKALQTHTQDDQDSDSDSSNKRKRFCNTYNILSKSGLLNITLRTKELIRQNRRTQAELDLLREHTSLFVEALQTGDLHMWSNLQLRMQDENDKKKTVNIGSETQVDLLK